MLHMRSLLKLSGLVDSLRCRRIAFLLQKGYRCGQGGKDRVDSKC